jgi:UDP-4-amino-4-deoxy-L-arabinose formyltransferase/UDP-glucuronic acid dehydrogenase (UDP-4-keto-hexauronic acid decarboxylating)
MVGTVDAGNVVLQTLVSIDPGETGLSLTVKCVRAGVPLIFQLLETLSMNPGALPEQTQDLTQRTFFGASAPHRGWLSWTSAADQVVNFVRAADFSPFPSPWGHPKTALRGRGLAIAKAVGSNMKTDAPPGTVRSGGHGVEVAAADEWVRIELLQVEGRYVPPSTILTAGDVLEGTQEA